ncbi:aspartate carbamoyltransferase [Methylomonas sp. HYX-M1]|uniref:aspartate carbamoyltransferase n=1 Tax=Methylomonas sp. HYX-M1 TaxID=3139307 RepID=UPI00345BB588
MRYSITSFLLAAVCAASLPANADTPASSARLDEVAERGRHAMPFALEKTLHIFEKTPHGGIQQVIANNPSDQTQIGLIRRHLAELNMRFKQGDFSRQRQVHGDTMPGLAELAASHSRIQFNYRELSNGAEIEYSAEDPGLVDAIHRYFNAQLRDHARHATDGKPPHCQHMQHKHAGKHHPHNQE